MNKGKAILLGTLALAAAAVLMSESSPKKSVCDTYAPNESKPIFIELSQGECDYHWPLSTPKVRIMCHNGAVTATDLRTNITYAVNGLAMEQGHPSLREVQIDGTSLAPILRLDLCE